MNQGKNAKNVLKIASFLDKEAQEIL